MKSFIGLGGSWLGSTFGSRNAGRSFFAHVGVTRIIQGLTTASSLALVIVLVEDSKGSFAAFGGVLRACLFLDASVELFNC